jgi:hypothetical protein
MKRLMIAASVAAISIGCLAPKPAAAGDGFGGFAAGLVGGLAAGTIIGAATAPPVVYAAPAPVYAPTCYWTRGRPMWDPYRGIWVRPRIQVCD